METPNHIDKNPDGEIDSTKLLSDVKGLDEAGLDSLGVILNNDDSIDHKDSINKSIEKGGGINKNINSLFDNLKVKDYSLEALKDSKEFLKNSDNAYVQKLYETLLKMDSLVIEGSGENENLQVIIQDIFGDNEINDEDISNLKKLNKDLLFLDQVSQMLKGNIADTGDDINSETENIPSKEEERSVVSGLEKSFESFKSSDFGKEMPNLVGQFEGIIKGMNNPDGATWSVSFGKNLGEIMKCFDGELHLSDLKVLSQLIPTLLHGAGEFVHLVVNLVQDLNSWLLQPYDLDEKDNDGNIIHTRKKGIILQGLDIVSESAQSGVTLTSQRLQEISPFDSVDNVIIEGEKQTNEAIELGNDVLQKSGAITFGIVNGITDFIDWGVSFPFELDATIYKIKSVVFDLISSDKNWDFLSTMGYDSINSIGSPQRIAEMIGYISAMVVASIATLGSGAGVLVKGMSKITAKFPQFKDIIHGINNNMHSLQHKFKNVVNLPNHGGKVLNKIKNTDVAQKIGTVSKETGDVLSKKIGTVTKKTGDVLNKIPNSDLVNKILTKYSDKFRSLNIVDNIKNIPNRYQHLIHKLHNNGDFQLSKFSGKTIYGLDHYGNKFVAITRTNGEIVGSVVDKNSGHVKHSDLGDNSNKVLLQNKH